MLDPELNSLLDELLEGGEVGLGARIRQVESTLGSDEGLQPPILICGCGHSGTTLLLSILGAHPRLAAIPFESGFGRRPFAAARSFQSFFNVLCRQADRQRWVEKTPMHIRYLPQLMAFSRGVKIVLCMRDGRDVACSIRNRHQDFSMGAHRWVIDNESAEPFRTHPRVHILRYESLVADLEGTMRALLDFLGEDWDPQILRYHELASEYYGGVDRKTLFQVLHMMRDIRPKKQAPGLDACEANHEVRYWQMSQPIFDGRGIWREQMSAEEKQLFKSIAGAALIRYGYAEDLEW